MLAKSLVLCYTKLLKFDYKAFYEKNVAFYNARPLAKRALPLLNQMLSWFFVAAYALLWVYALFIKKFGVKDQLCILFVPALGLLIVSVLRLAIEKPRPYDEDGDNITPLVKKKNANKKSFPSRHIACAMLISMTFMAYSLGIGIPLFLFALALAYIRFALGLHYPSDLIAGGAVGILVGLLAFFL